MKKIDLKKISKFHPIIGIILFVYIIIDIGIEDIADAFVQIPIQYYLLAALPVIPRVLLYSFKWQYICRKQKMDFSYWYLTKIFLISVFYGNVTPGGIGWHIKIFYLRKKSNASIEKCLTNSLLDSATGFIVGLFLALIGTIVLIDRVPGLFPIILGFFIFEVILFVVLIKKHIGGRLFNIFIKFIIPKKYRERLDKSIESIYEDIPRVRDLFFPFLIEAAIWILTGVQTYIIAQAFSIDIPFFTIIFISIIASIVIGLLPISIGGLGVREGTFVVLLASYGVPKEIAVVISLSGFIVKMVIPGIAGAILSFGEKDQFT